MKTKNQNNRTAAPASEPKPDRLRISGRTILSKACERILRRDGNRIANALFERAAEGNVSCARLLIRIIEGETRTVRQRQRRADERRKQASSNSSATRVG